jgi:uncharacterized membrane protein
MATKNSKKGMIIGGVILAATGGFIWWQSREAGAAPPGTARLIGTVTDADTDLPISGVTITVGSSQTSTNGSGQYEIDADPGSYNVTFSKAGYQGGSMSISLQEGDNVLNVQMIPTGSPQAALIGQVTDADTGQPISQVKVTLGTLVTYTNSSGQYSFEGLNPGNYSVSFEKTGYQTVVL